MAPPVVSVMVSRRSEEHTSELQSRLHLVCRLLLEKKQFETCTFPVASFHHREHVRVVWLYLQSYSVLETLARFSEKLKRFAAANGKANLYHETITWSYVFLINERTEHNGKGSGWDNFAEENADLLNWKPNILKSYYSEQ